MSRILISYRREDSAGHAGRLYDLLVERFGPDRIFMDVDTISPGDDFAEVIRNAVTSSDVLIALIGREWISVKHPSGHRRLDEADDFVALELATALERGIRVVPVLVQGAAMPAAADLPERLQPLARRNAVEISDTRFRRDAAALIDSLTRILEGRTARRWRPLPIAGAAALALAVLAAVGLGYRAWTGSAHPEGPGGEHTASAPSASREPTPEAAPAPAPATAAPAPTREPAATDRPQAAVPDATPPSPARRPTPPAMSGGVAAPAAPLPREARAPVAPAPEDTPRPPARTSVPRQAPSPPVVASVPPPTMPRLVAPGPGASMPQPSTQAWTFRWAEPASGGPVERYHLVVQGPGATWPAADITTSETSWTMPARGECSYVTERGRVGWQWRVRVQREGGAWSEWSTSRFDVDAVDRASFCRDCPRASICPR